ncbi:hypothetical protein RCJ22_37130, partial [Vibrio sp. FNV 38]|nr:hypothetical protein [Vibrio sp. FNV 38]
CLAAEKQGDTHFAVDAAEFCCTAEIGYALNALLGGRISTCCCLTCTRSSNDSCQSGTAV